MSILPGLCENPQEKYHAMYDYQNGWEMLISWTDVCF